MIPVGMCIDRIVGTTRQQNLIFVEMAHFLINIAVNRHSIVLEVLGAQLAAINHWGLGRCRQALTGVPYWSFSIQMVKKLSMNSRTTKVKLFSMAQDTSARNRINVFEFLDIQEKDLCWFP